MNSALGAGSSRFIAYALGEGDKERTKTIFNTTLTAHIILSLLVVLAAESIGYWFLHYKMIIPPDRIVAAEWVFHLSVLTILFTITQVPYNACIIAHEKMKVFAYVSIVDAVCKLLIVYLLLIGSLDKLILYAILHFVLQISILCFYRIYCSRRFYETHLQLGINKEVFKEVVGFSGWSLFANSAIALNSHGVLLILNMFFTPAVVAARSISIQVEMAAYQFVTNFQAATVPQIVKRYAQNDYTGSKRLVLSMTRYSFFLMLLMAIPILFSADKLLKLWLGIIPPYTVVFLQLIIIQSLFQVFDTSFYKALYAKGQLRENALLSPMCLFLNFAIVFVLFKIGFSPVVLSWSSAICYAGIAFIVKPILLIRIVNYTWKDIFLVLIPCLKVLLLSLPIPLLVSYYINQLEQPLLVEFIEVISVCVLSVAGVVWYFGLTREMRGKLLSVVLSKLGK